VHPANGAKAGGTRRSASPTENGAFHEYINGGAIMKFIVIWLSITAVILIGFSIAVYDSGNPDTALAGFFLLTFGFPVSISIMSIVRWALTPKEERTFKRAIVTWVMLIPLILVIVLIIYANIVGAMGDYIYRNTVYTHVMTIEVEGYTARQRFFLRPDGDLGPNSSYVFLSMSSTRFRIEDTQALQNFEDIFDVTLPEIDFQKYFYHVFPGQRFGGSFLDDISPYIINIYQVNIVRWRPFS